MYRADLQEVENLPNSPHQKKNTQSGVDGRHGGILRWIALGDLCGLAVCVNESDAQSQVYSPRSTTRAIHLPLTKQTLSSKALGDARALNVQDSFVDSSPDYGNISRRTPAQHTELLQAEGELIWNWRTRALLVMEKLRLLQDEEKTVEAGWKRFAISLCNLFSYEKEVESARLAEHKSRKDLQMPYRKLQKSTVDDILRIMAKQKMDRFTPSLDQLSMMISTYVADLSSVQPAMDAYLDALQQLTTQSEWLEMLIVKDMMTSDLRPSTSTLKDQIQAGITEVKKQLVAMGDHDTPLGSSNPTEAELFQARAQLEAMGWRLKENEELLQRHLTRLFKTAPVRGARVAYRFLQTEARQAGALHGSAINTKAKLNVASNDALSKMMQRHSVESKEDREMELQLVQRMVNLGHSKKFLKLEDGTEEVERGVEINKDATNDRGELRDKAIELCRGRIGRWDSKVAMAIMNAVGVDDANVRVEETSRELRLVRKLAIGLREHVDRCVEALEMLRSSICQGTTAGGIRKLRRDMMLELQTLLSGAYQPTEEPGSPLNIQALFEKGIPSNDPMGWKRQQGCGGAVLTYMDARDSGVDWLLNSFSELLKDYFHRVESVESFVYMECVGIQLEKHFSHRRAAALAAFEKKTDITSAINIATRKRMPEMVKELQAKLEAVGTDVSHTTVKEAKEAHLESKTLKQELHDLSMRQLTRTRETSTERVIALMAFWSREEESAAFADMQRLKELMQTLELSISPTELTPYLEALP